MSGKSAEAKQVLTDLQQLQDERYVSSYTVVAIYTGLGDDEQAFKWLERAVEERDIWLMNLKVDPVFAKLRSNAKSPTFSTAFVLDRSFTRIGVCDDRGFSVAHQNCHHHSLQIVEPNPLQDFPRCYCP